MAKTDIWMPLFIGDYLADTSRLTTEQHGAYLLLMMDYWRNGPPPDDDLVLANITKMQPKDWYRAKPTIVKFFKLDAGVYRHARIDQELLKAVQNAEKFAGRAKNAANKRWGKDASSNASSNATSIPQGLPEECPSPLSKTIEDTQVRLGSTIVEPSLAANVCIALKQENIPDINPTNPKLLALLEAGATQEEFVNAARLVKVKTFAYILGSVKNMRDQVANDVLVKGKTRKNDQNWRFNDDRIKAKAHELKINTYGKSRYELVSLIDKVIYSTGSPIAP